MTTHHPNTRVARTAWTFALMLALALPVLFSSSAFAATVLKVGATPVPHAEILNFIKPTLAKQGITLQVIEFTDYVLPNLALADKDLDANFFQHIPYLETFTADRRLNLIWVAKVHIEPMGAYSRKVKSLAELKNNAIVAIPNDPTNGGRALLLLEKAGLLKLKAGVGLKATVFDIIDNPKRLRINELEAAQLPRVLPDVDLAVINTNYALEADLVPSRDALIIEGGESPYANILVVRPESKDNAAIKALISALQSPEVRQFIQTTYKGAVVPAF
jgi:D-methionine transport system substrate-binding protein